MKFKTYLVILLLSVLGSATASALSIHEFAKMHMDDQAGFVSSLVQGAAAILKAQGHPDQAQKAIALFEDSSKNGGLSQFMSNLKMMEGMNTRNALNPNNRVPVYLVENAMERTLKDNGVNISTKDLLSLTQ